MVQAPLAKACFVLAKEFGWTPEEVSGMTIGQIRLPEICSNVCFGGTKRNRLFMTGSQSLYAVYVETQGAHIT